MLGRPLADAAAGASEAATAEPLPRRTQRRRFRARRVLGENNPTAVKAASLGAMPERRRLGNGLASETSLCHGASYSSLPLPAVFLPHPTLHTPPLLTHPVQTTATRAASPAQTPVLPQAAPTITTSPAPAPSAVPGAGGGPTKFVFEIGGIPLVVEVPSRPLELRCEDGTVSYEHVPVVTPEDMARELETLLALFAPSDGAPLNLLALKKALDDAGAGQAAVDSRQAEQAAAAASEQGEGGQAEAEEEEEEEAAVEEAALSPAATDISEEGEEDVEVSEEEGEEASDDEDRDPTVLPAELARELWGDGLAAVLGAGEIDVADVDYIAKLCGRMPALWR